MQGAIECDTYALKTNLAKQFLNVCKSINDITQNHNSTEEHAAFSIGLEMVADRKIIFDIVTDIEGHTNTDTTEKNMVNSSLYGTTGAHASIYIMI